MHGISRWTAGDQAFTVAPGQLLAVPPGVVHHMAERSPRNHHFYFAGVDLRASFGRHSAMAAAWRAGPRTLHVADAESLADPFEQLGRELTANRELAATGLALAVDRLVLEATRLLMPSPATPRLMAHPAVTRVRRMLDRNYARPWTLRELAEQTGLAPAYLGALFVREVGLPPHRYLTERRIERAKQLLAATDLPVTAIGVEVGFGSGQHFARVFRNLTGASPREYRFAMGNGCQPPG